MADKSLIDKLRQDIRSIEAGSSNAHERIEGCVALKKARSGKSDPQNPDDAFSKIAALVNVSDRSEATIRERLAQAGFEPAAIDEAVERAKACGFVDDMRYATVLVRSRLSQGKGIPGIERELRMQGIDLYEVPGWPEDFDASDEAEFDRALSVLDRRPPRSKNPREAAYRKLMGKGYSSSVAASAARAWCEAQ